MATARALAKATETAARLEALPRPEIHESMVVDDLRPEPLEAELDRTLHRQIGDYVEAWLRQHGAMMPADELALEVSLDLRWGAISLGWHGDEAPAGEAGPGGDGPAVARFEPFDWDLKVSAARPPDDPGLLAVSWKTQLPLLDNGSLLVFSTDGGRVERLLEWSADLAGWPEGDSPGTLPLPFGPTDVLNNLDFRLVERDGEGGFFVAAAWSTPSPHSSWGAVSWAILAPGVNPRSPRVLARGSDGVWQCYDDCYVLGRGQERDLVLLDYTSSPGALAICSGYTTADAQRVWRLAGGNAEELSLHSSEPFSFASQWIEAPWSEARRWGARGETMRQWHRVLNDDACQLERGTVWVEGCEAPRRQLLELLLIEPSPNGEPAADELLSLYFLFETEGEELRLRDITPDMPVGDWVDRDVCEMSEAPADAPWAAD